DLEAWELRWLNALLQLRRAKTAIQEELATWQLPRITIPDVGMPRLDVSGLQLPNLDLPAWRRQWDEAEQTAREGHQAIAREIQGIQWPPLPRIEMPAPDWPALAPPEAVISGLETVGRHLEQLQQKVAQLTPPDWQDWQVPPEVAEFARGTMI